MIGIFDSGSGGLTVLRHIRRMAPLVDVAYYADLARMPYGERSPDEITTLTLEGVRRLRDAGADTIVIACNSASAVFQPLSQLLGGGAHFVDTIEPTILSVPADAAQPIGIVATPATIASGLFQSRFARCDIATVDFASADLASAIESDDAVNTRRIIRGIIERAVTVNCRTLLLCCTHFPLALNIFNDEIRRTRQRITLIDPTIAIARSAVSRAPLSGTGKTVTILTKPSPALDQRLAVPFPA